MGVSLIVAVDREGGIGKNGGIPWRLRSDLRRFKALTMGHHLIVGRKTWESIGRALPGRRMVVVTRNPAYRAEGACVVGSLEAALQAAAAAGDGEAFVGGGAEIFRVALPGADRIYLTEVHATAGCDTFFPPLEAEDWVEVERVEHPAGEGDEYPYTDRILNRRQPE